MEVLSGVEPFLQPKPVRNPGGDCFACALTAALRHFFTDQPPDFNAVWEAFETESSDGKKMLNNTWTGMRDTIYAIRDLGYRLQLHTDIVRPVFSTETWSHAWWQFVPDCEWAYRLEAWLAAGWLALAEMRLEETERGGYTADGKLAFIDHFVVLDGQRHFWQQHATLPAHKLDHETHVVCSRKGGYWIRTEDLLTRHGVAAIRLIRPDNLEWRSRD